MQKIMGWAEAGNITVSIAGTGYSSSTKVQGSFPGCTVTVHPAGDAITLSSIYSDDTASPTAKANPFTADTRGTWFFYVVNGVYDITFSGGGILTPFTIGAVQAGTGKSGVPVYTFATLPAPKAQDNGALATITDKSRGLWISNGVAWRSVNNNVIDARDFGCVDDNSTDNTTAIQAAINASYDRSLHFPNVDTGVYKFTGPITIDANNLKPIRIYGDGVDAFGGAPSSATVLYCMGAGNGIEIVKTPSADSALQQIAIENLALNGDGTDATGGQGIYAVNVNNLQLRNIWISNFRENGVYFDSCFTSQLQDVFLDRNRRSGFYTKNAFHLGRLIGVRAFSNGRTYSSAALAGVFIDGVSEGNSAPRIESFDCEGQGQFAFQMFKRSDNSLTSIVVLTNVATAHTIAPHNRSAGELIVVKGATVDTDLNSLSNYMILATPTSTTFTFATISVADGTYTEATLYIGPWVVGIAVDNTSGMVVENFYCESGTTTVGGANGVYASGANVIGCSFIGSYIQGGTIFLDLCVGGTISGYEFTGFAGDCGLVTRSNDPRTQVDVSSTNRFITGATLTQPSIFKQDGRFFSVVIAAPATGAWVTGDQIWFTNAVSGGPPGIYCTAGGSPGTWKNMANLA